VIVAAERNRTRPKDFVVWLESLEAFSIVRGNRHVCMQTHSPFANTTFRGSDFCIRSALLGLHRTDAIPKPTPWLAGFRTCGDTGMNGG
jgi:hypothetical protein